MSKGKVVKMYGKQVERFVSIHPIYNGMYFYRVKQVKAWAEYWDDLNTPDKNYTGISNRIGCNAALTGLDDARYYMDALMANILDGDGTLELHIEHNKYVIAHCADTGYKYVVHHSMNFGDRWIHQGSVWRFENLYEMLEAMYGPILDGNWGRIPSKHLKGMQDA